MRKYFAAGWVALALFGGAALGIGGPVPNLPVPKGAAVILNTGSTNTLAYRVIVSQSGAASYVVAYQNGSGALPRDLARRFFADLRSAQPLSRLSPSACMKSASFGSATFVWWRGQRSSDLSCPGNARARALFDDASEIAGALHLAGRHAVPMLRPMLPNEPHRVLSTPPSAMPTP